MTSSEKTHSGDASARELVSPEPSPLLRSEGVGDASVRRPEGTLGDTWGQWGRFHRTVKGPELVGAVLARACPIGLDDTELMEGLKRRCP